MVYTKRYFVEITSLEKIDNDIIFLSLKRNLPKSFIKLYSAENILLRDIK